MPSLLGTGPGTHYKVCKIHKNIQLVSKTEGKRWVLSLRSTNTSCLLHELLPVNCSIRLDWPQRRLCRQISFSSVEQNSGRRAETSPRRITVAHLHWMGEVVWAAACVDCKHHQCHLEHYLNTRRGRSRARACRRRPLYFEGAKVPNFDERPPVFFLSEQSRMSTLSVQKFWAKKLLIISRNSEKRIWPHWPSSEVTEKRILISGVVLLCWILLHKKLFLS